MSQEVVKYDPNNYPDDKLAVQSNDVLFGQQSFTNLQRRIYLLAIAQIKRSDSQLKPYRVYIEDLKEYGVSDNIYSHMDRVTDGLMRKVFKRRFKKDGKRGWEKWPMVSWAKYIEGQGYIEIELHREMEELLLNLKEKGDFTPVPIANATACGSVYGSRIYAMLYSWRQHNKMEIAVSELREILKLKNQYQNFSHFRKYVLEKAQKDLQKHTNMRFAWEELKKARGRGSGRKITHLVFEFHFVADQMNMALEDPKKRGPKVDMSKHKPLQKNLREIGRFGTENVKKVLRYLEQKPNDKIVFHNMIYKTEIRIKDGENGNAKPLNSPEDWALALFEKTLPNFSQ